MTSTTSQGPAELADYGTILRRRLPLILAFTLVGLLLGLAATLVMNKTYQSTASVVVRPITLDPFDSTQKTTQTVDLDTEAQLVKSSKVIDLAKQNDHQLPGDLAVAQNINVSVPANSQVLNVLYTSTTAGGAQSAANAIANAYLQYKSELAKSQIDDQVKSLNGQLNSYNQTLENTASRLTALASNSPERAYLQAQQSVLSNRVQDTASEISRLSTITLDPGAVIAPAPKPNKPASPSLPINVLAGLMGGLLLGLAAAALRERGDRRLRGSRDIERVYNLPVLVEMPRLRSRREGESLLAPDSPAAEGIRRLRNAVLAARSDADSGRVIVVTSASSGSGASAVSANLAAALGRSGARTVLLCANLDESAASNFFSLAAAPGLSDMLGGRAELRTAATALTDPPLNVIPPGRPGPESVDLLRGGHLPAVLTSLRKQSDFVIVEAPPMSQSADAQGLAALAEYVVPVLTIGSTTRDEIEALRHDLDQVHARVLGSVVLRSEWPAPKSSRAIAGQAGPAVPNAKTEPVGPGSAPATQLQDPQHAQTVEASALSSSASRRPASDA
jgi:Mrp family chromosome partitioning ATPase/capsular polysaccharide biosynthesis protein